MQHAGGIARAKPLEDRQAALELLDRPVDVVLEFERIAEVVGDHRLAGDIADRLFDLGAGLVVMASLGEAA